MAGSTVCTVHGAGGGAPKGNQNARTHGGYAAVLEESFSPEDWAIYDASPTEPTEALDDTLRALSVREHRVLRWLLQKGLGGLDPIGGVHNALTSITNAKLRAIEAKIRTDADRRDGFGTIDEVFDQLAGKDDYGD
ncbi:MAG: hypothetical protein AAF170_17785 [Bacteroidota bacterium]